MVLKFTRRFRTEKLHSLFCCNAAEGKISVYLFVIHVKKTDAAQCGTFGSALRELPDIMAFNRKNESD